MARKREISKHQICLSVAKSLRDFGYPDVTSEMISECLDAFVQGKRDMGLPHGIIGAFASRQFAEVEEANPGMLARLT